MRDASSEFSAERIDIKFQANALLSNAGQISGDGLEVEASRYSEPGERQPIGLPVSCTAQLRKSLAKPGRCDHDLCCIKATGLDFARGQETISQQNHCRPVLNT